MTGPRPFVLWGVIIALWVLAIGLLAWRVPAWLSDAPPSPQSDAERLLGCMQSLANADSALTVQTAAQVCTPFESGWERDTIAFTGVSIRGHDLCDYVVTFSGRYRPWLPRPCSPDRLAYLERWAPVTEYSTSWYWIQRRRAEYQARARANWRRV